MVNLVKISLVSVFCLVLGATSYGQANIQLSENARISVITFGPYQPELWSAFGHSGIRVYDPDNGLNWMYDWGRFDFEQANFYWNFARGKMRYSIGRTKEFDRYRQYYAGQDRFILEQVLNLNQKEAQLYFDLLEINHHPENREYDYNYVYDNCGTRIRELTRNVLPTVQYNYNYVEKDKSVRDLMNDYLAYQPWGDFIIDVALAAPIDEPAEPDTYMFLPDYISYAFDSASFQRDSVLVPLVASSQYLYKTKAEPDRIGIGTPFNMFLLLFFVVGFVTHKNFRSGSRTHWLDVLFFSLIGFMGWWFTFLWTATDHLSMYNWNLLWAIPLHLPLVLFLNRQRWRVPLSRFYRFVAVISFLLIVFWALIPQPLHYSLIPLLLTIALRAFYISYDLGRLRLK